jgi:hypothetical protein
MVLIGRYGGAGRNDPPGGEKSAIGGAFNARFIGVSCTLFDRPATLARKHESGAVFAVCGPAFEPITKSLADPLCSTDCAPLAVEGGMATLAAKGMVVVAGGRGQFRLTLTAALPLGKSSHRHSKNYLPEKEATRGARRGPLK